MCLTPFIPDGKQQLKKQQAFPCGRCPKCKARRVSGWSFRLMQEDKKADSSYFITLTYATKHCPITRNGFMDLRKRDLQLFFKRLRKAHSKQPGQNVGAIKYYAVGEYGGRSKRPHYHIIIFNAKLELISPAWNLGEIHKGDVSGASVGYTMKYISKSKRIPEHRNDDRNPEFAVMSKNWGSPISLTKSDLGIHKKEPLRKECI